jgi:hypothetical protein
MTTQSRDQVHSYYRACTVKYLKGLLRDFRNELPALDLEVIQEIIISREGTE